MDRVYINEEDKIATVVVPDYQLSLAIGKEGQNARLAAKLTGWKVDIKCASQFVEENASNLVWPAFEDVSVDESLGDDVDSHYDQIGEETYDHW